MTASFRPARLPWLPAKIEMLPVPQPPDFPERPNPGVARAVRKATTAFADLLTVTIGTISEVYPQYTQLTNHVAQQYYQVVLRPALRWLRSVSTETPVRRKTLGETERNCNILCSTLCAAGLDPERCLDAWINLTIFDITYAVFAPEAIASLSCDESKALPLQIQLWKGALQDLGPRAVVFDVDRQMIGTSVPRWAACQILTTWQRQHRSECFPVEVKQHLSEVRSILETVVAESCQTGASLIDEGRNAVLEVFGARCLSARLCQGSRWLSSNGKLEPMAPCAGCQVIYAGVDPVIDNSPVPAKPLGQNFALPWQCAESHLLAQLFELEQPSPVGPRDSKTPDPETFIGHLSARLHS